MAAKILFFEHTAAVYLDFLTKISFFYTI